MSGISRFLPTMEWSTPDLSFLDTPRIRVRALTFADARRLAKISNSRQLARMMVNVPHPYSQEDAERLIGGGISVNGSGRGLVAGLVRRTTGALMGVGAAVLIETDTASLSYWLGENYWGRGYGTEFVDALVRFAFGSLHAGRISAKTFADNAASLKLQARLGFEQTGTDQAFCLARGHAVPQIETILLPDQYIPPSSHRDREGS